METVNKSGREGKITARIAFLLTVALLFLGGSLTKANADLITISIEAVVNSI
jgi:hypothetical protein